MLLRVFSKIGIDVNLAAILERPGLVEARKVENIQNIYVGALQDYVVNQRTYRPMNHLAKLLSILTELRTLSNLNSQMCCTLKLKNKKLPPFLVEIWDV
jgi:ecdysone receptor